MHARALHLISSLGLSRHPEGGWFREVYRATARVQPADSRAVRAALTTIYYLLADGDVSRWHRVASDEVWHYCEGDPLELFTAPPTFDAIERQLLGPSALPLHVVPANAWQAARSMGAYTLVACTVGPGFDFADFRLLREVPADAEPLRQRHPELAFLL